MMRVFLLVAAVAALAVAGVARADSTLPAPQYTVDLNAPARERWDSAVRGVVDQWGWDNSFGAVVEWLEALFPPALLPAIEKHFAEKIPEMGEYGQEIVGVYETICDLGHGQDISLGELAAMNVIYELTEWCTSTVSQSDAGEVYHGRNLDYSIPSLQQLTAQVTFERDGEVQYRGVAFVGYVGLLTGAVPGAWSVSIDQREYPDEQTVQDIVSGYLKNALMYESGLGHSIGFFLRDTLSSETNYQDALQTLATTDLIAPVFIIVGGVDKDEGAVITRKRLHPDASEHLGVWKLDMDAGQWEVLITNWAVWETQGDDRAASGTAAMEAIGSENIDPDGVYGVLSTPPVYAEHTIYTTVMDVRNDYFNTTVRFHDDQ